MKKPIVLLTLFYMILLLIVGCTNTDVASEEFEKKIGKLESKILDLEETSEKQQATIVAILNAPNKMILYGIDVTSSMMDF